MKTINPLDISEKDLPLIVLTDDRRGFLSWIIKRRTGRNYAHIMEMSRIGYFASQNFGGFKEVPVIRYMKSQIILKFWKPRLTDEQKKLWIDMVKADLKAPWINRRYDWLGVIGQALGIRWLQIEAMKYCGERLNARLRFVYKTLFPYQQTPGEQNEMFKKDIRFDLFGYANIE